MGTYSAALVGLLLLAEQGSIIIATKHPIAPEYHRYDYETTCGSNLLQVRFGNDGEENGRVDHLLLDGRPVADAAEALQIRAARRLIMGIEILDCGIGPRRSVLRGTIDFEPGESRRLGMRSALAFRLIRERRGSWRMTIDQAAAADSGAGRTEYVRRKVSTGVFGPAQTGLPMLAQKGGGTPLSENTTGPKYRRYDYESACGASVFRVGFRNRSKGGSRVDHVLIDSRPVLGGAKALDRFAARREIDRIEIMNCGMDAQRPLFRGIMVLSKPEAQPASRQNTLFFRLVREGEDWRIAVD